jgi:hypothetical protein
VRPGQPRTEGTSVETLSRFTNTCVDEDAFSTKLRIAAAAVGGICVPKLIVKIENVAWIKPAYTGALLYCTGVNMNPPGGSVGAVLGLFAAAAWCGKGSIAWAYVQVIPSS